MVVVEIGKNYVAKTSSGPRTIIVQASSAPTTIVAQTSSKKVKEITKDGVDYCCWNVHISEDFHNWIKNEHKNILLIFVPTNCTNELKPTNVIL